jgi:sarcosine oxidase, subunit delta
MLLIHCPYCEEARPELEFRHAGEAHVPRPAGDAGLSDEETARRLYYRSNERGIVFERWRHGSGCGRFFNAARHSVTDKFVLTYKAGEPKPDLEGAGEAGFDANVDPRVQGDPAHTPAARTEAQQ